MSEGTSEQNTELTIANPLVADIFALTELNIAESDLIKLKILDDGSLRFMAPAYHLDTQSQLIKITAITLPAKKIWSKSSWITLEFKKPIDLPLNLSIITSQLEILEIKYIIETLTSTNGYEIRTLEINSNDPVVLAYLANMYLDSPIAHLLIKRVLSEIVEWSTTGEDYQKTQQRLSIILDDLNENDDDVSGSSESMAECPTINYSGDVDYQCLTIKSRQEQELQYVTFLRTLTKSQIQEIFHYAKLTFIATEVSNLLQISDPESIKRNIYNDKYEKVQQIFNTTEQCHQHLYQKHPNIKNSVEKILESIIYQLHEFKEQKADELKNIKDVSTLFGVANDFVLDPILSLVPAGNIGKFLVRTTINVAKAYACTSSLATRKGWFKASDIDQKELVKEFGCKVIICNVENFSQLNSNGINSLSKFYSQYLHLSIVADSYLYQNQSSLTQTLLENLSNFTHLQEIGLGVNLDLSLETESSSTIPIKEYLKYFNQVECYDRILNDFVGHIELNPEFLAIAPGLAGHTENSSSSTPETP